MAGVARHACAWTELILRNREAAGFVIKGLHDEIDSTIQIEHASIDDQIVQLRLIGAMMILGLQVTLAITILELDTRTSILFFQILTSHYILNTLLKRSNDTHM